MKTRSLDDTGRTTPRWLMPAGVALAIAVLAAAATPAGANVVAQVQFFFSFFAGVITLVSLSLTVMVGLLATDRVFLKIKHRVLAQALHRATSVIAVTFLISHIVVKILTGYAEPLQAVLPIHPDLATSLGTVAGDLLLFVAITGALRGRFAVTRNPKFWRTMHAIAYLCWPIAIWHGLVAGRPAALWVIWSYGFCLIGVTLGVMVRVLVRVRPNDVTPTEPQPRPAPQRQAQPAARASATQARVAERLRTGR